MQKQEGTMSQQVKKKHVLGKERGNSTEWDE
jgi:hypothetical protein